MIKGGNGFPSTAITFSYNKKNYTHKKKKKRRNKTVTFAGNVKKDHRMK